ncbi:MAG: zinc-finger domain-containing protein [Bdellovibrionales bacterium]
MPIPAPPETITIDTPKLYCDGGAGSLGHPRVFLVMTRDGTVDCPYCGRHFVLAAGAKAAAH